METYTKVGYLSIAGTVLYIQIDIEHAIKNKKNFQQINKLFREAFDNNNVKKIIYAYTLSGSFYKILNHHLTIILRADNNQRIKIRERM